MCHRSSLALNSLSFFISLGLLCRGLLGRAGLDRSLGLRGSFGSRGGLGLRSLGLGGLGRLLGGRRRSGGGGSSRFGRLRFLGLGGLVGLLVADRGDPEDRV